MLELGSKQSTHVIMIVLHLAGPIDQSRLKPELLLVSFAPFTMIYDARMTS